MHAAALMRALQEKDPGAEFRFMGGEQMEAVGGTLLMHYRETSYMLLDVLFHLRRIFRNLARIKREIIAWDPDVVIPVDYPGFNMRIMRHVSRKGMRVFYYISPKVWAWKERRVRTLRRHAEQLFVILPFEKDYFRKHGMEVAYHGNPLVDGVSDFLAGFDRESWMKAQGLDNRPVVALLPGSRVKEVSGMLPAMLKVAGSHPDHQFVVAGAPSLPGEFYEPYLAGSGVLLVRDSTYGLLASARTALVTSGTATLEAALFSLPQVVLYRTSPLAYSLARMLIRVKHISLVNLILGRDLVKEIIQKDLFPGTRQEFERINAEGPDRERILRGYGELKDLLGAPGVPGRIAEEMVELIKAKGE